MANGTLFIFACILIVATFAFPHPGDDIITQPKPGEEYVFVQTSGSGARPIARKDKHSSEERSFETAHKFPPSVTYALNQEENEEKEPSKIKVHKREANPAEGPAPAPAGAIKLDVRKLLEKYKTELKTSTTAAPKTTTKRRGGNRRTKKEAKEENVVVTSPSPILTTGAAVPKQIDDDIPLVASGSEKQRSRIQIKKAPNGQEYEYEYVYYYYDDEDDKNVTNAHDGPAREQISKNTKNRGSTVEKTSATPEANEVLPAARGKTRGRQLEEEEVGEDRLPANTRFPPRSRNLNTTPLPEEETKATRGRGRGRPTTETAPSAATEADNVSDETQGSRGRTRANVRRPSLELVDNASFNTHPGSEPSASSPSFPTDLPAGPVRFLGATPNESVDPPEPINTAANTESKKNDSASESEEPTTVMSAMDKVALDLYAILQGTQKLSGEDGDLSSDDNSTSSEEVTTLEGTTVEIETTTPTTTTTTTTTTTPAPTTTTTTTTEAPVGRGRFKGRGRKTSSAASTTEATHAETKPKSKFSRPSFGGRHRPGGRTTTEAATEHEVSKEESKPVSHSRPTLSRSRFGGTRSRTRTTTAASETQEENASSTSAPASHSRPSLTRPRSSFNLRTRGRSTTAAPEGDSAHEESVSNPETASTTARTRRIQASSGVRPLRPGPRINLARGRPGQSTTTTEHPAEDHVTGDETSKPENTEQSEDKETDSSPAPIDNSPLGRLKNKHRVNVQPKPKAAASAPVQVRRVNPLLGRRRPGQTTEASTSEATQESISTETAAEVEESEDTEAPVAASSTTTEEPRGLNKLLAGRKRLATRPAAHH